MELAMEGREKMMGFLGGDGERCMHEVDNDGR